MTQHQQEPARQASTPEQLAAPGLSPEKRAEALVQEQLDAYNARDIDAFVKPFGSNVVGSRVNDGAILFEGDLALRRIYTKLFGECPNLHCELKERTIEAKGGEGVYVTDKERVTGRVPGEPDKVIHADVTYLVADGRIQRAWFKMKNN